MILDVSLHQAHHDPNGPALVPVARGQPPEVKASLHWANANTAQKAERSEPDG